MLGSHIHYLAQVSVTDSPQMLGMIRLSGAYNAELCLLISEGLIEHLRGLMFSGAEFSLNKAHSEDVLRELINMLGGCLKNVVPEPTVISLPRVLKIGQEAVFSVRSQALIEMCYGNEAGWLVLFLAEDPHDADSVLDRGQCPER
jgi:hypothetical protein